MFELSVEQLRALEALLSPFGLIVVVQAGKWLARRLGAEIGRGHIRIFLGALAAGLAYLWLMPVWPQFPLCVALEPCVNEIALFVGRLAALGSAWYGAAHVVYERLARGLFAQLGLDS